MPQFSRVDRFLATILTLSFMIFGGCSQSQSLNKNLVNILSEKNKPIVKPTISPIIVNQDLIWNPEPGLTFDWVLSENLDMNNTSDVIDIDGFLSTKEQIDTLHQKGKKVIGYISVGTLEEWTPDAKSFPSDLVGNKYTEWKGEKWLNVSNINKLAPMILARLDMIKQKGFDAVEPDNLDGFQVDSSGFNISIDDEKKYCDWLIVEAHKRGLSIGLKNLPEFVADYANKFDWMLTEGAYVDGWINKTIPFIKNNKAVFVAEYTDTKVDFNTYCNNSLTNKFSLVLKNRNLGNWSRHCK